MALRVAHFCKFNFRSSDPVVVGSEVDGGTSLAGIQDTVAQDGGGYWQWTLNNGTFGGRKVGGRETTLMWRALNAGMAGGIPFVAQLCDKYHQPINGLITVPHSDGSPFSDGSEYISSGASAVIAALLNGQGGGLNCTMIDIAIVSERPLLGGERFTHVHETWRDRCYEIISVTDNGDGTQRVQFQPPARGGMAAGDALDFDNPRCVMKRSSQPTNAFDSVTLQTSAQITLVEYMVDPDLTAYP